MADTNKLPNTPDSEDRDDVIEMIDEDGESTLFEHLATLEHQGETFLVLTPSVDADADEDEDLDIVIMQVRQDEQGQDIYVRPEEPLEDQVFEKFLSMMDELEEEE